ncbi:MAG: ethanolamine utilization protein EutN [Planctomycetota bacterium]|nr:MAG: ethanolamine utilization protein EutN [Planctomycetota bacterium]
MILGRVVGTVWATRKDDKLQGLKLLVVERLSLALQPQGGFVVAADACEAGVGEVVLVAQGSSARQTALTHNRPVDAVIMAIVDNLELEDAGALERSYALREQNLAGRLAVQPEI